MTYSSPLIRKMMYSSLATVPLNIKGNVKGKREQRCRHVVLSYRDCMLPHPLGLIRKDIFRHVVLRFPLT